MEAINAITTTIRHKVLANDEFESILCTIISPEIRKILQKSIDDYAIFITIQPTDSGSEIIFNDGGATWDEELEDMVYTTYAEIKSNIKIDQEYELYFSIDEGILCFLSER